MFLRCEWMRWLASQTKTHSKLRVRSIRCQCLPQCPILVNDSACVRIVKLYYHNGRRHWQASAKQEVSFVAKTSPLKAIVITSENVQQNDSWLHIMMMTTTTTIVVIWDIIPYSFIMFSTELNVLIVNLSAWHFTSFFLLFFSLLRFIVNWIPYSVPKSPSIKNQQKKRERERAKHQKQTHRRNKWKILIEIELQPIVHYSHPFWNRSNN